MQCDATIYVGVKPSSSNINISLLATHTTHNTYFPTLQQISNDQSIIHIPDNIMAATVHVKGISSQTSEKEVRDFFSFW
jgi:Leucine-rich repeat (LRR) protein